MNDLQLRSLVEYAPAPTKAKPKVAAAGQLLTVGQVAFKLQLHDRQSSSSSRLAQSLPYAYEPVREKRLIEYAKKRLKNGS